jgi:hypothetical protein
MWGEMTKPKSRSEPCPVPRLLDLLVGIGEALCPPWKRRSRAGHAAIGLLALGLAAAVVVYLAVRLVG